ncbi:hypothetical protein ADM99_04935 [Leptolinea tardivitalis]|uniref:Uncharacterized protein n=1 Tax=Leptolinea tardivitalis TaxID=229920 RepID=A0A0P6WQX8_9CHLR|nr:hypothetical protein ADM99_04935 [Leptolinea tardivitalis]GAP21234.1 hypothetical protein LTAR_01444 [Leptolinea tardivitalis]
MTISYGIIKHISSNKKSQWFGLHRYSTTMEGKIQIISYEAPILTGDSVENIKKQVEKILLDIHDCPVILVDKQ